MYTIYLVAKDKTRVQVDGDVWKKYSQVVRKSLDKKQRSFFVYFKVPVSSDTLTLANRWVDRESMYSPLSIRQLLCNVKMNDFIQLLFVASVLEMGKFARELLGPFPEHTTQKQLVRNLEMITEFEEVDPKFLLNLLPEIYENKENS